MSHAQTADLASIATVIDHAASSPVVLHAPHGSTRVPACCRGEFLVDAEELAAEHLALTDHGVDAMVRAVAAATGASAVISELSRLVMDPERFDGPEEEMAAVGMGVLYTHGSHRQRLRSIDGAARADHLAGFRAYSAAISDLVRRALEAHGHAVLIDLHSYPTRPLPYELHAEEHRPPLCVGYEDQHMTPALRTAVAEELGHLGQGDNQAFHGAYVPLDFYGTEPRVSSVMLEIRRDQYMDETDGHLAPQPTVQIVKGLTRLVRRVGSNAGARR